MAALNAQGDKIYKYMNFDQIEEYKEAAQAVVTT
jgi:aconitate hydratase 2/2-methylisocitrate dehydratase